MKKKRMSRAELRKRMAEAAARIISTAIKHGWAFEIEPAVSTQTVYFKLRHPKRGRVRIRLSDHLGVQPYRYCLHVRIDARRDVAAACGWLADPTRRCRARKAARHGRR